MVWIHTANYEKSVKALERNVRILETQIEEEEYKDPRTVFYLAKTYFDIGTPEKLKIADSLIDKYIAVSSWDQEKVINVGRDNNMDMIFCTYWYACVFNEKGQVAEVVINHERERFIKPGSYKWVSRLHEVCIPTKPNPRMVQYGFMPQDNQNLVWIHTANYEKSVKALERNVRILETQIEEEEYKDPRTVFYLAKTYFDIGTPEKLKIADSLIDKYITPLS